MQKNADTGKKLVAGCIRDVKQIAVAAIEKIIA